MGGKTTTAGWVMRLVSTARGLTLTPRVRVLSGGAAPLTLVCHDPRAEGRISLESDILEHERSVACPDFPVCESHRCLRGIGHSCTPGKPHQQTARDDLHYHFVSL